MKPFEVEFKPEDNDMYRGRAGVGCTILAIVWAIAAIGGVALGFAKLVMR